MGVPAPVAADTTARLEQLLDPGSLHSWRVAVGDGVHAGSAQVQGRPVCVWAQDPRHRGGSLGTAGGETIARTIKRASRAGVPVVGVPDSGGARLQEGAAALGAYAAIFHAQSHAEVPHIALIGGVCAGGAAYSAALADFVMMIQPRARMFLTGPRVVEQVTRESVSDEDLGGHRVHSANGVAHLVAEDDWHARLLLRELLSYLPSRIGDPAPRAQTVEAPSGSPADHLPAQTREVYDIRAVIGSLVDGGEQLELAARWARNMVTTLARLDGRPVGVIANQPRYIGGAIDSEGAQKGTWFVNLCDRLRLPLVVLVDTPGFLPGQIQETSGVIRHGAALVRAFATATLPRMTVTLRQAYGGAHIVMNSRDLGADLTLAWPGAQVGVMGASQAVAITERRAIADGADPHALAAQYADGHLAVHVAASKGLVDEIVAPEETRGRLIKELAMHATQAEKQVQSSNGALAGWKDEQGVRHPLL
jgi:acetyl-CoA carboxylase carboxyltransferase component